MKEKREKGRGDRVSFCVFQFSLLLLCQGNREVFEKESDIIKSHAIRSGFSRSFAYSKYEVNIYFLHKFYHLNKFLLSFPFNLKVFANTRLYFP